MPRASGLPGSQFVGLMPHYVGFFGVRRGSYNIGLQYRAGFPKMWVSFSGDSRMRILVCRCISICIPICHRIKAWKLLLVWIAEKIHDACPTRSPGICTCNNFPATGPKPEILNPKQNINPKPFMVREWPGITSG